MSAEDFQALKDDIEVNGQREPVMVFEGMVLDGWHRYRACTELGLQAHEVAFDAADDPVAFVLSHNLHRRHLSASQRAAAVVACTQWAPAGRPFNPEPGSGLKEADMAKAAGTSDRTIRDAKAAHRAGLGDAVKDGAMTAKEAAKVARGKPVTKTVAPPVAAPERGQTLPPAEDFGPSEEEVADALREQEEELASLRKIAEADDKLAAALAENKQLRALNRVLQERVNGLMEEKNAALSAATSWQRKAQKFERQLKAQEAA